MNIFYDLSYLLSGIIFIYLAANSLYLFFIALAGRLIPKKKYIPKTEKRQIAILIPCYKEDHIILDTARRARFHDYPESCFSVTVIADKLQPRPFKSCSRFRLRYWK